MTFLAPGFLFAAFGVAALVTALHFIVTRQPRAGVLPTARFIPDLPATATARATRPSDLLLMLLRILIVLAAGTALAGPVIKPTRAANARVILVDVSRSLRGSESIRDSALGVFREGDAVVLFDSSARRVDGSVRDTLASLVPSARRGNLSGALIAALRAGSELRERADSVQLVIVSPFAAEEIDAATDSIRALWPGSARIVRLAALPDSSLPSSAPLAIKGPASDPLQVTVSRTRAWETAGAWINRGSLSPHDSASAPPNGRIVIEWPATDQPRGAVSRAPRDTIGGVIAGTDLVVAAFERRWQYPRDSLRGSEIVARWIDGEPAVVEWTVGDGCVRSVSVPVPSAGDLAIRDDFVRFFAGISGECASGRFEQISALATASLEGRGGMAARDAFPPGDDVRSTYAPWLFGIAIAAALAELFVRRSSREARDGITVAS